MTNASSKPTLELLRDALDRDALGHALLLVSSDADLYEPGPLFDALNGLKAAILCPERKPGQPACGRCTSCRLALGGPETPPHPDLVTLDAEGKLAYTVEDARSIIESFTLARSLGAYRLAWIPHADKLGGGGNPAAANALLKLIEEPRPQTMFVLLTSKPDGVLPTIRSRCHTFRLPRRSREADAPIDPRWEPLLGWLKAGAPEGRGPTLPADDETFWKDRERAIQETEELYTALWRALEKAWPALDREAGLRCLRFFKTWERTLGAIRGYAAAPLQWLQLRSDARLDR